MNEQLIDVANELKPFLEKLLDSVTKIRKKRNKVLAHSDFNTSQIIRDSSLFGISRQELREVIDLISVAFNTVANLVQQNHANTLFLAIRTDTGTDNILASLERAKKSPLKKSEK